MSTLDEAEGPPQFNQALADTYVGKYMLIGITHLSPAGQQIKRRQIHGIITHASPKGIIVALKGPNEGTFWTMPPALEAISLARPGEYSLRETGETITNPDLLSQWEVTEPQKH
jgi:hypothetical protein